MLQECYGTTSNENVAVVKTIYEEAGVKEIYTQHQEEQYNYLNAKIQSLPNLPKDLLFKILKKLYKRSN